jgi:hypothetical protein
MSYLQIYLSLGVFAAVILAIAFNVVDMTLAVMLGASILMVLGILTQQDILKSLQTSQGMLSLLFGGMVVARTLKPTGIFDNVGVRFVRATRGSGKRFLLLLIALVAPICAVLPRYDRDPGGAYQVSGCLRWRWTLSVDGAHGHREQLRRPAHARRRSATFLVGSSIGMTFAVL